MPSHIEFQPVTIATTTKNKPTNRHANHNTCNISVFRAKRYS